MRVRMIALAVVVVAGVGACAGDSASSGAADAGNPAPAPVEAVETARESADGVVPSESLVARPSGPVDVFGDDRTTVVAHLDPTTELGSARALLVVADEGAWLKVALPLRPNGSEGWIRRAAVEIRTVTTAIQIDVDRRTLTFYDRGEVALETSVAVGATEYPTPRGQFFVTDFVETPNPHGAYGPYAFGLSGHSDTLTEFAGGDGQIGIHGTNDAASIGRAASHGCVRVPNEVVEQLATMTPLGTPVLIA